MTCKCTVCGQDLSKYKCPTCCVPYCSLPCWKTHKSQVCNPPANHSSNGGVESGESSKKKVYQFETEDTVPIEKLELLANDPELRQILENPHVRNILTCVDKASDPAAAIAAAMVEPIFVEFADRCLKLVEPPPPEDI